MTLEVGRKIISLSVLLLAVVLTISSGSSSSSGQSATTKTPASTTTTNDVEVEIVVTGDYNFCSPKKSGGSSDFSDVSYIISSKWNLQRHSKAFGKQWYFDGSPPHYYKDQDVLRRCLINTCSPKKMLCKFPEGQQELLVGSFMINLMTHIDRSTGDAIRHNFFFEAGISVNLKNGNKHVLVIEKKLPNKNHSEEIRRYYGEPRMIFLVNGKTKVVYKNLLPNIPSEYRAKTNIGNGTSSGCSKDTDCKGNRVCVDGKCKSLPAPRPTGD